MQLHLRGAQKSLRPELSFANTASGGFGPDKDEIVQSKALDQGLQSVEKSALGRHQEQHFLHVLRETQVSILRVSA